MFDGCKKWSTFGLAGHLHAGGRLAKLHTEVMTFESVETQPTASAEPAPAAPKRRPIAGVLALALVAGAAGAAVDRTFFQPDSSASLQQLAATSIDRPAGSIAALAAKLTPSVVAIKVQGFRGSGTGSGFVIKSDGYILTNDHVVTGAGDNARLTVVFADGSSAKGKVVGSNSAYDLAVVKVDRKGLPAVTLGNSDNVVVGDSVIAIGSPLGLQSTVTSGIISALDRPVTTGDYNAASYISAMQTDAAINPGNSGGPLIDGSGAVIGINSAIATLGSTFGGESGSIGLGFAIPINQAKRIAEEIMQTGTSKVPVMGVGIDMGYAGVGARVGSVKSGEGAAKAGIRSGDIITKVDGRQVADATELIVAIRSHLPGDRVKVTLGNGKQLSVLLGADTATN